MNIFVLCPGRTASTTFSEASSYFKNHTSAHESNVSKIFSDRLSYPENHIEVDNRLTWFLGQLDRVYGDNARYVVLQRDKTKVAESYFKRWYLSISIVRAFSTSVLMTASPLNDEDRLERCEFFADTVEDNIRLFLKDKTNIFYFDLGSAKSEFERFVEWTNLEYEKSGLDVWDRYYNLNKSLSLVQIIKKIFTKILRIVILIPSFIRWA